MNQAEIDALKDAVERVHRSPASYRATERVRDKVDGEQRQFEVAVFDILGHPRALICYAWYAPGPTPDKTRPLTALREGPIHSSLDAVRFSLDQEAPD
jgi:hypothetical protein